MTTTNELLLNIDDLSVWYKTYRGSSKVVDHVSISVERGEKIGIVGESGCGKTTTMKLVLRILDEKGIIIPNGRILFEGEDILTMDEQALLNLRRNKVSMISQLPMAALNPVLSIGEQLIDYAQYADEHKGLNQKELRELAAEAITSVMISDAERIMSCYPHQLSGGMRQRICIAASLISSRELLIADEPGTALDVTVQDQIHRLLRRTVEEHNKSLIMITHSLGVIRELVDRVYVMYAGQIIEHATTAELFKNPLHPYTKGLFECVPRLTGGGLSEGIYGYVPDYVTIGKGCRFANRCELKIPICTEERPALEQLGDSHFVSCHVVSGNVDSHRERRSG